MIPLRREHAPLTAEAWDAIDEQAKLVLRAQLGARKLVDFDGPHGWSYSAVNLGRTERLQAAPVPGIQTNLRQVQPLLELVSPFSLARAEMDAIARGADDPDLQPLVEAVGNVALCEDHACFSGYSAAGIQGIVQAAAHAPRSLHEDFTAFPQVVAEAMVTLREAGVDGPYAIALGSRCYTGLQQTTGAGGYPVIQHVQRLIEGPVVWAPAVEGAVVLSVRGGDFRLVVGQDVSIGYESHDAETVRLYVVESMTFRLITPEAAVPLDYPV